MNGFNRNYAYRSTEAEKKERKDKKNREEVCKCKPFVKFHYHDCPVVMKPCPIHGNFLHHTQKEKEVEKEQNVIISFHPSSKTERLLQPIKSLLAHCNSETKINFQYYSPDSCISKESLKSSQNGQKAFENVKRTSNNSIFIEKTKSFVTNKRNKVKKLKQCFHSPCNSIAQKTRSQTSIKEKINQILREEAKQTRNVFYNMMPEIPPDDNPGDNNDPVSRWFCSSKGDFKKYDILPNEKIDSDFITVTQHDKNNAIHHKIFEIKHRKGLNDIPFVGFSKQPTQLVYSTVNVNGTQSQTKEYKYEQKMSVREEENEDRGKRIEVSSSEKTCRSFSSSSSGSVYITPFIFLPKGMENSETENEKPKISVDQLEQAVQVEDLITPVEGSPKGTQTSPQPSKNSLIPVEPPPPPEPKFKSVLLQTDFCEIASSSRHIYVHDYDPCSATVEEITIGHELAQRNIDDDNFSQNRRLQIAGRRTESNINTRTMEMQTSCPYREVFITAQWNSLVRDQISQTDDLWSLQVSVRTLDSRTKSTMQCTSKSIQTGSYLNTPETPKTPEIRLSPKVRSNDQADCDLNAEKRDGHPQFPEAQARSFADPQENTNGPNGSHLRKPCEEQDSFPDFDIHVIKTCWGKSHSDSDLCDRIRYDYCKCDTENPMVQPDVSKYSNNNTSNEKSTYSKVCDPSQLDSGKVNCLKTGTVTLRTKETLECFSDTKQTSTREEEISAAVSDLSELKKLIQDFFEKRSIASKKSCECDTLIVEKVSKEVQTIDTKKKQSGVSVQTVSEEKMKTCNVSIQTSYHMLLNAGEENADSEKIKLRQSAVVDNESRTTTFFVCALCRREVKNVINATTNTEAISDNNERRAKGTAPKDTESLDAKGPSKKQQTSDMAVGVNPQKSKIPVSSNHTYVRFKNNETVFQAGSDYSSLNWTQHRSTTCHTRASVIQRPFQPCICDVTTCPSTSKGRKQSISPNRPNTSRSLEPKPETAPKREQDQQNNQRRGTQTNLSRRNEKFFFPVMVTPFWLKDFMKTWKSLENSPVDDNLFSDDSKTNFSKQKRTYEKELETIVDEKRMKVVDSADLLKDSFKFSDPNIYELLREGKLGDIPMWPSMISSPPEEDERSSTANDESPGEETLEKLQHSSYDIYPENDDEFIPDSELYSESNSVGTSEISLFGDEDNDLEDFGETALDETEETNFESFSKLNQLEEDPITAEALNTFWVLIGPKNYKRALRKNLSQRVLEKTKPKRTEKTEKKKNRPFKE